MIFFQKFLSLGIVADAPKVFSVGASRKASLRLKVPRSYTTKDGDVKGTTDYVDVVFWGKNAEKAEFLHEGAVIYVEGAYKTDSYEKDGKKVYKSFINADVLTVDAEVKEEAPY